MQVVETKLPGVLIVEPKVFGDERGFFMETWNQERYADKVSTDTFVQDNVSFSRKGVLRGLHFQKINPQGKLVYVLQGEVFDVAVDIRLGSPHFGQWTSVVLSSDNKRQFFIPAGFAHGFVVTSETADFLYKTTDYYAPQFEGCIAWNDPQIGIQWPELAEAPKLSAKDQLGKALLDVLK